jgi:hypothetical protein
MYHARRAPEAKAEDAAFWARPPLHRRLGCPPARTRALRGATGHVILERYGMTETLFTLEPL